MGNAKRRREIYKKAIADGRIWVWYPPDFQGDPMYGSFERVAGAIARYLAQKELFGDMPLHLLRLSKQQEEQLESKICEAAQPILSGIRESCEKCGKYEFDHIRDWEGDLVEYAEFKPLKEGHSTDLMVPIS